MSSPLIAGPMRILILSTLLVCAACDSASPITRAGETISEGVTFRVNRTEVRSGATLELALINGSDRMLSTGSLGCATVERRVEGAWTVVPSDNERACILPIFVHEPGEAHEEAFLLDVEPGTVRLYHTFGLEGGDFNEIRSPAIRVLH